MTRQQSMDAYRRVKAVEHSMTECLRETILVPYFGGNLCRQHNCRVNFECGIHESPVNGKNHKELADLSRRYDYEQRKIWDVCTRLADHFAQSF